MAEFLLEIGTEEIPARMIAAATAELAQRVSALVERERLTEKAEVESFSTPRRIAVLLRGLATQQSDIVEQMTGPARKVAYKDGAPTPAAHAFAKKAGVALESLETVITPKGEYLAARVTRKGRAAAEILAEALPHEIASLYWAKNMYWRQGKPERFVRPLRWMVALLDHEIVPVEFAGVKAGRVTRGHRVLFNGEAVVNHPSEYASTLEKSFVLPTHELRQAAIRKALDAAVRTVPGARWREDEELLASVVNLTECPSVILGSFEEKYLSLPEEVLVTVMRDHQKYFAVEDANGKLAPYFLAVLNTSGDPDGLIRHGNERVLRARFNDARFFWDTDQKQTLHDRVALLKSVTFQKDLGSYFEKAVRTQQLASQICESLREADICVRPGIVHKAALMAKTDLTAELVKEFTELQGVIGGLYMVAQGGAMELSAANAAAIGEAIYDQYKPASMEDSVPRSIEGAVLALADKADTIAGMFSLGLIPSGSKDPFALRRAANGIVRILAVHKLPLSLAQLMRDAARQYEDSAASARFKAAGEYEKNVAAFFGERLEFFLREVGGYAYDVIKAVLASGSDGVLDAMDRAAAVGKARGTEDFEAVSASFKRIQNILRQAGKLTDAAAAVLPEISGNEEPAELALLEKTQVSSECVALLLAEKKYDEALNQIASIRKPLDEFFDKIMVMSEDESVRERRLRLLQALYASFSSVADFSEIVTGRQG
jgi:glycyl-tRNA synthetase beta chain